MTETKAIQNISEGSGEKQVNLFISQAIEKGMPVETMERLFDLQTRARAENAKSMFVQAMSEFQKTVPTVKKTKKVLDKYGKIRYVYAPIDSIVEQIKKPLADCGLSYSWESTSKDKMMSVTCKLVHISGHFETSSFEVPIGAEYMTAPQQYASALSFARRYTLCNVLGISTADEDTDATTVNKEATAKSLKSQVTFLLRELNVKGSVTDSVKKLTGITPDENNLNEVISRLEALVQDKNANS
jgi:hypothetical protein